jgi:hypothetical protein
VDAFVTRYQQATAMLVGQGGVAVEDLLTLLV